MLHEKTIALCTRATQQLQCSQVSGRARAEYLTWRRAAGCESATPSVVLSMHPADRKWLST